ncbi:hypothetical protein KKH3_32840 [Pectobacterium actinidiae]|nr:hypothetical protein KKH3_32840 [Pectobacterium actinidiae]
MKAFLDFFMASIPIWQFLRCRYATLKAPESPAFIKLTV